MPESAFHLSYKGSEEDLNRLWDNVKRIYLEAKTRYKHCKDENAWCMKVAQRVMSYGLSGETRADWSELESVQSQSINLFSQQPKDAEIYQPLLYKG